MNTKKKCVKILFYSPQGGSGKSTIAVSTAIFSALFGNKTLLIDMADYGCVGSMLKIPQKGAKGISSVLTIIDLHENEMNNTSINEILISSISTSAVSEKLNVLMSGSPMKMESINEKQVRTILNQLQVLDYDVIIFDSSSTLSVSTLLILEEVELMIMPVIQDISCGWKTLLFKELIEKCNMDLNKIKVCVNRCSKYNCFNNQELEEEIGFKSLCEIPNFYKKFQCHVNEGMYIHQIPNKKVRDSFSSAAKAILSEIKSMDKGKKA